MTRTPRDGEEPLVTPAAVRVIDLAAPLEDICLIRSDSRPPYRSLLAVARGGDQVLGAVTMSVEENGWVSRERLICAMSRFGFDSAHGPRVGAARPAPVTGLVSVVVATCGYTSTLEPCVRAILRSDYDGPLEVIVVENRPAGSATHRMLATTFGGERRLRYVEESRAGASRARNAGLAHARGTLVAFVDDDVVVDPAWMRRSTSALTRSAQVGCCTGLILPFELETVGQLRLEQFAAFGKGFRPKTYRLPEARRDDPLLPYTVGSIGSGASVWLKADVVRRLGGFDTVLGPGTPTTGAEDLDVLLRVLRAGHALTYEPSAIVWHRHPSGMRRLRRQAFRYGVGLGAMLAKHALAGPERRDLLRAVPEGVRYLRDPSSRKNAARPIDFPRDLIWRERAGMLIGPPAYVLSVLGTSREWLVGAARS
jgi:GT2 family glycosyltransferase